MILGGTQYLTTADAGRILGISPSTVRAQIQKGKIRAEKHGRDLFISVEELERYARENQTMRRGGRQARPGAQRGEA